MQADELRLVLEALGGNTASFGELAGRYSPTVMGLVYTYVGNLETARDITQDVMVKAYTALSTLQRPERFGAWIRQIAANMARSHLRQIARHPSVPLDAAAAEGMEPELPAGREADSMDVSLERKMVREEILRRLQAVPEGPRMAVVLHYLMGLSPIEAARQLGISRAAFDTRLSRGREALRKELSLLMDDVLTETHEQVSVYLSGLKDRVRSALEGAPHERAAAAKELALLATRANLPRLSLDLISHDQGVRKSAAQLLGETGDHRAAEALTQALGREQQAQVLCELCRSLSRIGVVEAVPLLQQLSRNTADMNVHKAAAEAARDLEALGAAGSSQAEADIPVTIDDLKEADIESLFLDLLADSAGSVRVHAVDGLGRVESVKAVPQLITALRSDEQEFVRRAAAEALGAIIGRERTSRDRITPAVRNRAIRALADALGDPGPSVVADAAWSLSLADPAASEESRLYVMERFYANLESATQKPGPWVATYPSLLGSAGVEADRMRLAELLLRQDFKWKAPFAEAVWRVTRPGASEANGLVLQALRQAFDPRSAPWLVRALGKSQDAEAVAFLRECLGPAADPRMRMPVMREAAAQGLAEYPDGIAFLQQSIQEWLECPKPDEAVILAAVAALEAAGSAADAVFVEEIAGHLSPRAQISAKAAARRLAAGK